MNTSKLEAAVMLMDTPRPGWFALVREDLQSVFARDPAARSSLEVLTLYPGFHAVMAQRLAHALWRRGWRYLPRFLSFAARTFTNIDIHPGARIGRRFFIDHGACVVIGETAEIGDDVTLYHGVTLGGTTWKPGKRHPTLGDGVVVGAGAKILGAITVGDGARIGANSVVVHPVPPGRTAVGVPARIVSKKPAERASPATPNMEHHQVPDPLAPSIAHLIERIESLEAELRDVRRAQRRKEFAS